VNSDYSITLTKRALRELKKLEPGWQKRIHDSLNALAQNPLRSGWYKA